MSFTDQLNNVARVEKHRDDQINAAMALLSSASRDAYAVGMSDRHSTLVNAANAHATLALVFQGQLDILDQRWARIEAGL